ncbi:hypothetical protein ACFU9Y_01105 [Streptomyces sp. NPDC057621]|uniref:hypothetical protein n=1 Tax=Streptomyces sp. NPDC057621 TaxID=3346186 RepID=UPI003693031F
MDDPEQRISEPYHSEGMAFLLAEDSREVMADFAARLGCVYEGCRYDGSFGSDNDPCYAWCFRLPQAQNAQTDAHGWPLMVEECRQQFDRMFADRHYWHGFVDARRTRALNEGQPLAPLS